MRTILSKAFMLIAVLMVGTVTIGLADGASEGSMPTGDFKYVMYAL